MILDETLLFEAVDTLAAREPRFAVVLDRHGVPPLRKSPEGFAELLRLVTEQAISLKAAEKIWRRLSDALALTPLAVMALGERRLFALGLSGAKARCFCALATAVTEGRLTVEALSTLPDTDARAALTAIPGIGPWTADNYLLSALGRADVWPAGDIALQEAARDLFALETRPGPKALTILAEPWRPWRAAAARLLWSHYRHLKRLPQDPLGSPFTEPPHAL